MSDFNEIINSDKPTLVDFHAVWCGPCRMLAPIIEDVKSTLGDKVTVLKVDVDQNRDAAVKYGIRGVPTMILFKNGEPIWRRSGVMPKNELIETITPML